MNEIIFNIWAITDSTKFVFSYRIMAYVGSGSDSEKYQFLQSRAICDYLIAEEMPVPDNFKTQFEDGTNINMIHYNGLLNDYTIGYLVEPGLKIIEERLPKHNTLTIPGKLIMCLTPLNLDDNFNLSLFPGMKTVNL